MRLRWRASKMSTRNTEESTSIEYAFSALRPCGALRAALRLLIDTVGLRYGCHIGVWARRSQLGKQLTPERDCKYRPRLAAQAHHRQQVRPCELLLRVGTSA